MELNVHVYVFSWIKSSHALDFVISLTNKMRDQVGCLKTGISM